MTFISHLIAGVSVMLASLFGQYIPVPATESHVSITPHVVATSTSHDVEVIWENIPYLQVVNNDNVHISRIPSEYYSDGKDVFFASTSSKVSARVVPSTSPATFKAISKAYGTDGFAVYFQNKKISEADPATFYVVSGCGWIGVDAKHHYIKDAIYSYNPTSTPDTNIGIKAGKEEAYVGDC